MRFLKLLHPRNLLPPAVLALVMLVAGCQSSKQALFDATGPGWRVEQGQAIWRPRKGMPELAGDLIMAANAAGDCCLVQFSKTPISMLSAQTTRTNWLIQFPPRKMSFDGRGRPPTRFAWLHLHSALTGEQVPAPLRFERKADGGWRLENTRTGETLEGFLGR